MALRSLLHRFVGRRDAPEWKSYVGPPEVYERSGTLQFAHLKAAGLLPHHKLIDVGCGSLRAGRHLIAYLEPEGYCGLEPNKWLIDEGVKHLGLAEVVKAKRPAFAYNADFDLAVFTIKPDFILAQSILSHTSRAQMRALFRGAAGVSHPGTLFFATYLKGADDYAGTEWIYPGPARFRPETVRADAAAAGLDMQELDWEHTHKQTWVRFSPVPYRNS